MTTEHAQIAVRDPVCGMAIDPSTAMFHATANGADYHFWSAGCKAKFVAEPTKYLGKAATPSAPSPVSDAIQRVSYAKPPRIMPIAPVSSESGR